MRVAAKPILWASALWLWTTAALADDRDFSGTVRRIFDGDSFLVRPAQSSGQAHVQSGNERGEINVRLQDIDAPERAQPYGLAARAALVDLIADRDVFVDVIGTDRYQRKIVRVFREPDRLDLIKALVRDGHVWVYRRKVHDHSLIALEDAARAARRGLWALPEDERMPPWQYRYLRRKNKKTSLEPGAMLPVASAWRPWYSESAEAGRFHDPITPVTAEIVVLPRTVSGGEAGAGWPVVVPQPVEVAAHFQRQW